ncbi:STE24 endopeptidase [Nematocida minor]|uniref:STE24 endopeptidase n=1 Tax=Nematocida minor TaxID=1912983 RepID=UPI00221F35FC|nr:STE24 endopeptidase [Nematocida minor]KAI5189215.1 STE24 endopeptidase [Nematocida minor]
MQHSLKESIQNSHSYKAYRMYFSSRLVVLMLTIFLFHVVIVSCEALFMIYCEHSLKNQKIPEINPSLEKLFLASDTAKVFESQAKIAGKWAIKRAASILIKSFDFIVIIAFFSHGIRNWLMPAARSFKGIIKINSSHMSVADNTYLCLSLLALGMKSVVAEWIIVSKQDYVDLLLNTFIQLCRCLLVAPILVWLFSSVYNKTKYGLILAAYMSIIILILISNCTSILPDSVEGMDIIPAKELGPELYTELVRLKLENKIYWDQEAKGENAALVKTGASKYILVMGDLLKYGKKEFISFIAHEVGHADDQSTEKKLLASILGLGLTCGCMLGVLHVIVPKYERRGVSPFSVVVFLLMANMYIFSGLTNMFYNNLYILSEVNADIYAKKLGFGSSLANGLYRLMIDNSASLFHSTIYTYYAQDHPAVSSRVAYLNK